MFFKYAILNIKQIRQYKSDFLIGAVPHFLSQILNIAFFRIVLSYVTVIEGWSFHELLFVYGQSLTIFGLYHLFFGNLRNMKALLFSGEFEIIRLRPINPIYHIMISSFQTDAIEQVAMGVGILVYSICNLNIVISIEKVLGLVVFSVCGVILLGALAIVSASILLLSKGSFSPLSTIFSLKEFTKYPLSLFDEFVVFIFTWIIPISTTSYYPALFFLREETHLYYSITISVLFFIGSVVIFSKSLKKYEGMSS